MNGLFGNGRDGENLAFLTQWKSAARLRCGGRKNKEAPTSTKPHSRLQVKHLLHFQAIKLGGLMEEFARSHVEWRSRARPAQPGWKERSRVQVNPARIRHFGNAKQDDNQWLEPSAAW